MLAQPPQFEGRVPITLVEFGGATGRAGGTEFYEARLGSLAALEAEEDEALAVLANGDAEAITRSKRERVDLSRGDGDRHLLHGGHAEDGDRLVADEDQVGGGAGNELTLDLVGGGPEDRSPQARREGDQQPDEQEGETPARSAGRAQDAGVSRTRSCRGSAIPAAGRRRSPSTCRHNPRGPRPRRRGSRCRTSRRARRRRPRCPARR